MNRSLTRIVIDAMEYKYEHQLLFPINYFPGRHDPTQKVLYQIYIDDEDKSKHIREIPNDQENEYHSDKFISIFYGISIFDTIEDAETIRAIHERNKSNSIISPDDEKALKVMAAKYHNPFYDILDVIRRYVK